MTLVSLEDTQRVTSERNPLVMWQKEKQVLTQLSMVGRDLLISLLRKY